MEDEEDDKKRLRSRLWMLFWVLVGVGLGVVRIMYFDEDLYDESLPEAVEEYRAMPFATEELRIGGPGTENGKFTDNRVVGVDLKGWVYSADNAGGRVQVFDAQGKFVTQWPVKNKPIQSLSASRDGTVYLVQGSGLYAFEGATGEPLAHNTEARFQTVHALTDGNLLATVPGGDVWWLGKTLHKQEIYEDVLQKAGAPDAEIGALGTDDVDQVYILDASGMGVYHFSQEFRFIKGFAVPVRKKNEGFAISGGGRVFLACADSIYVFDENMEWGNFPSKNTAGMVFNKEGFLWTASRPYLLKYKIKK